jgi:hypothetical protein
MILFIVSLLFTSPVSAEAMIPKTFKCSFSTSIEIPEEKRVLDATATHDGVGVIWRQKGETFQITYQETDFSIGTHNRSLSMDRYTEERTGQTGRRAGKTSGYQILEDNTINTLTRSYTSREEFQSENESDVFYTFDGMAEDSPGTHFVHTKIGEGRELYQSTRGAYVLDPESKNPGRVLSEAQNCTVVASDIAEVRDRFPHAFRRSVEKFNRLITNVDSAQAKLDQCQASGHACVHEEKALSQAMAARDKAWPNTIRAKNYKYAPERSDDNEIFNRRYDVPNYEDRYGQPVRRDIFHSYYDKDGFPVDPKTIKDQFGHSVCDDAFNRPMRGCD